MKKRYCINCEFYKLDTKGCTLLYMNLQDAANICKYSDSDFERFQQQTLFLRQGVNPYKNVDKKFDIC